MHVDEKMDMTLDELVKMNKKSQQGSGGRGRGRGGEGSSNNRRRDRYAPYKVTKGDDSLLNDGHNKGDMRNATTRLYISNLHGFVHKEEEDLKAFLSQMGRLRDFSINYDENGLPQGNAEVEYMTKYEALKARETLIRLHLTADFIGATTSNIFSRLSGRPHSSRSNKRRRQRKGKNANKVVKMEIENNEGDGMQKNQ